ncbi:P-loop NTPase fold protein [Propionicimonas paludicola]|uniref:P-loop NTPase fold protein n=1 Tax=Propionicimonas paludicola TaxID=185243 RepID=UPI001472AC6C|nr:P-loop NTPase fold protein [Propionicimonas paludicola]
MPEDLGEVWLNIRSLVKVMLAEPPLSAYSDEHQAIADGALQGLWALATASLALYRAVVGTGELLKSLEETLSAPLRRNRVLGIASWGLIALSVLVAALGVLLLPWSITWVRGALPILDFAEPLPVFIAAATLLVVCLIGRARLTARRLDLRDAITVSELQRDDARDEYTSALQTGVRQELNAALSRVLDSSDTVPVRVGSLQLIETRRSEVVESRAVRSVLDFINTHEASALGLAGQRGIGKTTILQHLARTTTLGGGLAVMVTVPVLYEPEALVRRIYGEFLRQARVEAGRLTLLNTDQPRVRARTSVLTATTIAGVVTAAVGTALFVSPDSFRSWFSDPVQATAITLIASGYVLALFQPIQSFARRQRRPEARSDSGASRLEQVLDEAAGLLQWTQERSYGDEISTELPARLLTSSNSASVKHTERPIGRPELAQHFRRTVEEYATRSGPNGRRVLICVDELDKIEQSSGALQLVNELKDLMHVGGTHFLLSVSEDALRGFSLRGVHVRDAVDSTFDEVFEVRGLTAAESHAVIVQRAPEFPPPLTRFCHAWSLGVPRDLLRAARHCIAVGAANKAARRQLGDLVRDVVTSDVRDAITAQLSRTGVANISRGDRELLLQSLDQVEVATLRELLGKYQERWSADAALQWRPVLGYLDYASKVLRVFGVERKYGEWRALDATGALDKSADDLVKLERQNRLI